jgi:hypothetical protein
MRLFVVLGASLAALAVWFVADVVVGVDLAVRAGAGTQAVGPVAVLVASLAAGLVGWGVRALLDRITSRGRLVWTVVALAVLVGSLLGPLSGVDGTSRAWLALLHLTVAAGLIPGLGRATGGRSATGSPARSGAREAA